jgi:hypothetical protein
MTIEENMSKNSEKARRRIRTMRERGTLHQCIMKSIATMRANGSLSTRAKNGWATRKARAASASQEDAT